jgi:hypothetical protein
MNAALRPIPDLSSVRFWHILLVAGAISPLVAFASLPAQDEDILCASTDVVVGTVVKATRSDLPRIDAFCGYKPWDCSSGYTSSCQDNPHDITLRIRVSNVLGSKANQTFDPSPFYTRAEQDVPAHGGLESVMASPIADESSRPPAVLGDQQLSGPQNARLFDGRPESREGRGRK